MNDALDIINKALNSEPRQRGGVGGQTIEASLKTTFHEISAWDLFELQGLIEDLME